MQLPLGDLVAEYHSIQPEVDAAIRQVLESGQFILGRSVRALEQEVASYLGVPHAVGVGSGTDALVLALRALEIGPGDEVVVPAYTFFATAEAVLLAGARPVFVDIEPETYCLNARHISQRLTPRTKAVIPVHLFGHPAAMGEILEIAEAGGLKVVEDNAQAFGAEYNGRKTGSFGDAGCLSFFPSKNLGGYGDGGMVVCREATIAERVRMLRTHGWRQKYLPEMIGYNSRLDEMQAAILRVKFRHVESWNQRRIELAGRYQALAGAGFGLPPETPGVRHVYHLYIVRTARREEVQALLREQGIASAVYYPRALHLLDPCRFLGYREGDFPVAEAASRETLAIPLHPHMTDAQLDRVLSVLGTLAAACAGTC
jgi:dTDP-4-amino-4,6-dideoxygalactose transaminase